MPKYLDLKKLEKELVRQPFDDYIFDLCNVVSSRSTCVRRHVGAVIVKDHSIVSTGYNGAPRGCAHCIDIGCLREKQKIEAGKNVELCRGAHAEQNAISQAARWGISLEGAEIYCYVMPCSMCTKAIIGSGIRKVHFVKEYPDSLARKLAEEAKINIVHHAR